MKTHLIPAKLSNGICTFVLNWGMRDLAGLIPVRVFLHGALLLALAIPSTSAEEPVSTAADFHLSGAAKSFLSDNCLDCHDGEEASAGVDLATSLATDSFDETQLVWEKVLRRVRDHDMPPDDAELPSPERRQEFVDWLQRQIADQLRQHEPVPGPAVIRRLNRHEYALTIRDLLDVHVNISSALPDDGAGGEGFDNAAETLFVSPVHAEKYLDAAQQAITHALADKRSRETLSLDPIKYDEVEDRNKKSKEVLGKFLSRAFRRKVDEETVAAYAEMVASAEEEPSFETALRLPLEAALVSPEFLFHIEQPNEALEPVPLTDHELAARLSYFLWTTMPDAELRHLADEGKLQRPHVLESQVLRMLGVTGNERQRRASRRRLRDFTECFAGQWLGTRALGREIQPRRDDYDSELAGGMKYEPVFLLQHILTEDRSVLELIDADYTFANRRLANFYGLKGDFREQIKFAELPEHSPRGGLLTTAAVLTVTSRPHRTSPVLRGKWVLESLLGNVPPPPPPDVPSLDREDEETISAASMRERLELHRAEPKCAACHRRMDPLGFALEHFDELGKWRTASAEEPMDATGTLPDGTSFAGADELKQVLLNRRDEFVDNLTRKLLAFALGRGLRDTDRYAIQRIVDQVREQDYSSHALIFEIVKSAPFRYKASVIGRANEHRANESQDPP